MAWRRLVKGKDFPGKSKEAMGGEINVPNRRKDRESGGKGVESEERSRYRWVVLATFGLALFTQSLLWLTFAPIETEAEVALDVGRLAVRLLALVDPLIFILGAAGLGILADRRGFRFTVGLGLCLMAPAALTRAIALRTGLEGQALYRVLLAMQVIISVGACCCVVCLFQMPVKWFPERQRGTAAGLTSMSLLLGNAAVFPLVNRVAALPASPDRAQALRGMGRALDVLALMAVGVAILFFALVREEPRAPCEGMTIEPGIVGRLLRLPGFRALTLLFFFGMGIYITMMVAMEKIMAFHGLSSSFAAVAAGSMTLGGILGTVTVPTLSERLGRRRPFVLLPALTVMPLAITIAFVPVATVALVGAVMLGFFLLSAQPVIFTMLGEMEGVGPGLAGTAVGILFGIGSIGQIVVPLLLEIFSRTTGSGLPDYRWSMVVLGLVGLSGFLTVMGDVPETGTRAPEGIPCPTPRPRGRGPGREGREVAGE
jgi:MFS family permease